MDVPWKYLNFFMDDDEKLADIGREYSSGRMLTGEIKAELIKVAHGNNPSFKQGSPTLRACMSVESPAVADWPLLVCRCCRRW